MLQRDETGVVVVMPLWWQWGTHGVFMVFAGGMMVLVVSTANLQPGGSSLKPVDFGKGVLVLVVSTATLRPGRFKFEASRV